LSFWKISPEKALAFSKQKVLRFWGLTGQRGWAHLILGRLHDLVPPPDDSKCSVFDPSRSRMNTTVSPSQTMDMVLPMLPASAGALASKVPVCSCIIFFVKFPP
jgi:hypothetical protein